MGHQVTAGTELQQGDGSSSALRPVALVLADVGGYARFMRLHALSVVQAEEIVTELLDAVMTEPEHPLRLNKLEGRCGFPLRRTTRAGDGAQCAQPGARVQ